MTRQVPQKILDEYSVSVDAFGRWQGHCQWCGEHWRGSDIHTTQLQLIKAIQKHSREEHGRDS